jgi:elongation factor Ts
MAITASMVKQLRERTGAGMMECKNALTETDGDIDAAIEALRIRGVAQADKKAGRIAAEGIIVSFVDEAGQRGVLAEVNCETDFVAKDENFVGFAHAVARTVADKRPGDIGELGGIPIQGGEKTIEESRLDLVSKIGENVSVRRFTFLEADDAESISVYQHGGRIAVLVVSSGGRDDLGKDVAMHIAASRPICVKADDVPEDVLDREREIYKAQAADSGKPEAIMEKIVEGRLRKFIGEVTLMGQPFVREPDMTVETLLHSEGAAVRSFVRYEVGEGMEKREDDFVAEVMAQAKGS